MQVKLWITQQKNTRRCLIVVKLTPAAPLGGFTVRHLFRHKLYGKLWSSRLRVANFRMGWEVYLCEPIGLFSAVFSCYVTLLVSFPANVFAVDCVNHYLRFHIVNLCILINSLNELILRLHDRSGSDPTLWRSVLRYELARQ